VVALFLGPYLTSLAKSAADPSGYVYPLGIPIDARSFWSYMVSLSVILQVLVLPVVGAIADYGRRKREALVFTAYFGALVTMAMFFLDGQRYLLGGVLFILANVTFGASIVIYNSFLPEIAGPEARDRVSSVGWGIGYIGGGVLLALNLVLYLKASAVGISEGMAVRISLCSAGAWWALFTIPAMLSLKNRGAARSLPPGTNAAAMAFRQLGSTFGELRSYPQAFAFLMAYLLYNDAIQAVLALATQFGSDELKMPVSQLTMAILMAQFVGFFGAIGFDHLARRITAHRAVMFSLVIWTAVLFYIYLSVKTAFEFFILVGIASLVMGGSQALSRSLFAQLVPKGREAEYFGIYEISDKGTSWLCPILFGLALQFTKSYRLAILSLVIFFVAGLAMLARVNVLRGIRDVEARAEIAG
jgi:MFS transporter, UMF1 family